MHSKQAAISYIETAVRTEQLSKDMNECCLNILVWLDGLQETALVAYDATHGYTFNIKRLHGRANSGQCEGHVACETQLRARMSYCLAKLAAMHI